LWNITNLFEDPRARLTLTIKITLAVERRILSTYDYINYLKSLG